ncbi:MAG TPA: hypothetical protein VHE35_08875 [Kofleriaceae bacterium]|nr:hypothetical protein [Kofleriaceae bacterium]
MKVWFAAVVIVVLRLMSGCVGPSTTAVIGTPATPLGGKGNVEVAISNGYLFTDTSSNTFSTEARETSSSVSAPWVSGHVLVGLSDSVDVGLRVSPGGDMAALRWTL